MALRLLKAETARVKEGGQRHNKKGKPLVSAILAIALLLWLLWRRAAEMLLVLTPLLLGAVLTAASMAALGISFNFANVIVIPLLLGIGVDSGIHLVHRAKV